MVPSRAIHTGRYVDVTLLGGLVMRRCNQSPSIGRVSAKRVETDCVRAVDDQSSGTTGQRYMEADKQTDRQTDGNPLKMICFLFASTLSGSAAALISEMKPFCFRRHYFTSVSLQRRVVYM